MMMMVWLTGWLIDWLIDEVDEDDDDDDNDDNNQDYVNQSGWQNRKVIHIKTLLI